MPKFSVSRSITIEKHPDEVFDIVSDFGTWTQWSPWLCAEPDAEVKVSTDSASIGAKYSWNGKIVGAGELQHDRLEKGKRIEDTIRFLKPFKSQSDVSFDFEPVAAGTKTTWNMNGSLPWFMFWMKPMMESFIGMDYERGLKMLKEWMETNRIKSKSESKGVQSVGPLNMSGIRRTSKLSEIAAFMEKDLHNAKQKLEQNDVAILGCMSVYHNFKIKTQIMDYTSGFVTQGSVDVPGLSNWNIGNVNALRVDHTGSYDHLGNAWFAANQIARNTPGMKQSKAGAFEVYKNDPTDTAEEDLITEIYLPLK